MSTQHQHIGDERDGPAPHPDLARNELIPPRGNGCERNNRGLRGNPEISAPINFVRFEPYVLAKRSLTGDTTERVDTRVLQAIYEFAPSAFPAFVGQQVDVFIAAPSRATATRTPTSGQIAFSPVSDTRMQITGGASNMPLASRADQPSH